MPEIILALRRTLATLGRGRVWFYFFAPALAAILAMVTLWVFLLGHLIASFIEQPPFSWIADWGALWLAKVLAALGGWLIILSLSYLLAILITAIIVLPLLLKHLSAVDYPDVALRGSDSLVASTWNSLWAALLYIAGWLLTLPLWLVPGFGLILPFFWMAWLNRSTFAYDALAAHASAAEWKLLRREQGQPLFVLGLLLALLGHLPLIGLLAPSLAALAYIHFCLEALRRMRQGALVST